MLNTIKSFEFFPSYPNAFTDVCLFCCAVCVCFPQLQLNNESVWRSWATSPQCEVEFPRLPTTISSFQRLLVIKVLRYGLKQSRKHAHAGSSSTLISLHTYVLCVVVFGLGVWLCRPERLHTAMTAYVCNTLGLKSIAPPSLQLHKVGVGWLALMLSRLMMVCCAFCGAACEHDLAGRAHSVHCHGGSGPVAGTRRLRS